MYIKEIMKKVTKAKAIALIENISENGYIQMSALKKLTTSCQLFRAIIGTLIRTGHSKVGTNEQGEIVFYPHINDELWRKLDEVPARYGTEIKVVPGGWKPVFKFKRTIEIIKNPELYTNKRVRISQERNSLHEWIDSEVRVNVANHVANRPREYKAEFIEDTLMVSANSENAMKALTEQGRSAFVCLVTTVYNAIRSSPSKEMKMKTFNDMFWEIACPEIKHDEFQAPLFPPTWDQKAEATERQMDNLDEVRERFTLFLFNENYVTIKSKYVAIEDAAIKPLADKWFQDEVDSKKAKFNKTDAEYMARQLIGLLVRNQPVRNRRKFKPLLLREISEFPRYRRNVKYRIATGTWLRRKQAWVHDEGELAHELKKWIDERSQQKNIFRSLIYPKTNKAKWMSEIREAWVWKKMRMVRYKLKLAKKIFSRAFLCKTGTRAKYVTTRLERVEEKSKRELEKLHDAMCREKTQAYKYLAKALAISPSKKDFRMNELYESLPHDDRRFMGLQEFAKQVEEIIRDMSRMTFEEHPDGNFVHVVDGNTRDAIRMVEAETPPGAWYFIEEGLKHPRDRKLRRMEEQHERVVGSKRCYSGDDDDAVAVEQKDLQESKRIKLEGKTNILMDNENRMISN